MFWEESPSPPAFVDAEKSHQMYTSKMEEAEVIQAAGG